MKCSHCGNEYRAVYAADLFDGTVDKIQYLGRRFTPESLQADCWASYCPDMLFDPTEDEWLTFVSFEDSRNRTEDNFKLLALIERGRRLGIVASLYRHSGDLWFRKDSRWVPDVQWDCVRRAGMVLPSEDAKRHFDRIRRRTGQKVREQMIDAADNFLKLYSHWRNGQIYEVRLWVTFAETCPECAGDVLTTNDLSGVCEDGVLFEKDVESQLADMLRDFGRDVAWSGKAGC